MWNAQNRTQNRRARYTDEEILWVDDKEAGSYKPASWSAVLSTGNNRLLKKLDQEITVLSQDVTLDIVQTN